MSTIKLVKYPIEKGGFVTSNIFFQTHFFAWNTFYKPITRIYNPMKNE